MVKCSSKFRMIPIVFWILLSAISIYFYNSFKFSDKVFVSQICMAATFLIFAYNWPKDTYSFKGYATFSIMNPSVYDIMVNKIYFWYFKRKYGVSILFGFIGNEVYKVKINNYIYHVIYIEDKGEHAFVLEENNKPHMDIAFSFICNTPEELVQGLIRSLYPASSVLMSLKEYK